MSGTSPTDPEHLAVKRGASVDLKGTVIAIDELLKGFGRWGEANSEALFELARKAHRHLLFESAGWLPHYTTPFSLVEDDTDAAGLSAILNGYYLQKWTRVRGEIPRPD
jgi:hypothetical protein